MKYALTSSTFFSFTHNLDKMSVPFCKAAVDRFSASVHCSAVLKLLRGSDAEALVLSIENCICDIFRHSSSAGNGEPALAPAPVPVPVSALAPAEHRHVLPQLATSLVQTRIGYLKVSAVTLIVLTAFMSEELSHKRLNGIKRALFPQVKPLSLPYHCHINDDNDDNDDPIRC